MKNNQISAWVLHKVVCSSPFGALNHSYPELSKDIATLVTRKHETHTIWTAAWSNEKQMKYNDRNKVCIEASEMFKKHYFFLIIMAEK